MKVTELALLLTRYLVMGELFNFSFSHLLSGGHCEYLSGRVVAIIQVICGNELKQ